MGLILFGTCVGGLCALVSTLLANNGNTVAIAAMIATPIIAAGHFRGAGKVSGLIDWIRKNPAIPVVGFVFILTHLIISISLNHRSGREINSSFMLTLLGQLIPAFFWYSGLGALWRIHSDKK